MDMIRVMIVDDEPQICELLRKMVERQPDCQVIAECGGFSQAVVEFTKKRPDVAFVDIDLNGENGLECAKVFTELNPKVKIIFATAHSEYMANAFEIYAFDYLVKPFNMERVARTLQRIRGDREENYAQDKVAQSEQHKGKLLIKGKERVYLIDAAEIIFVERVEGATNIVTRTENFRTSISLTEMEEKLKAMDFMRCHKSYLVNLTKISRIEPYGRWTYIVKFRETEATALMTAQRFEEVKKLFA